MGKLPILGACDGDGGDVKLHCVFSVPGHLYRADVHCWRYLLYSPAPVNFTVDVMGFSV
jgi:hypothetical protein